MIILSSTFVLLEQNVRQHVVFHYNESEHWVCQSAEERRSCRSGVTRGRGNDDRLMFFGVNCPFKSISSVRTRADVLEWEFGSFSRGGWDAIVLHLSIRASRALTGIALHSVGNPICVPWKMTALQFFQSHGSNSPAVPLDPNWIGMSRMCRVRSRSTSGFMHNSVRTWWVIEDVIGVFEGVCLDLQLCVLLGDMWLNQINGPGGRGVRQETSLCLLARTNRWFASIFN